MRISDWSSDVCSSDLHLLADHEFAVVFAGGAFERAEAGIGLVGRAGPFPDLAADMQAAVRPRRGRARMRMHRVEEAAVAQRLAREIGRASWRERVWQSVEISVGDVTFKKQKTIIKQSDPRI